VGRRREGLPGGQACQPGMRRGRKWGGGSGTRAGSRGATHCDGHSVHGVHRERRGDRDDGARHGEHRGAAEREGGGGVLLLAAQLAGARGGVLRRRGDAGDQAGRAIGGADRVRRRHDGGTVPVCAGAQAACDRARAGVYALALEPGRPLKQITLQDGMTNGAFALVALTLGEKPGRRVRRRRRRRPRWRCQRQRRSGRGRGCVRGGAEDPGCHRGTDMDLDCTAGLRVTAVRGGSPPAAPPVKPGPLFRLETESCGSHRRTSRSSESAT